jgi:putative phosphonate metabolism protein
MTTRVAVYYAPQPDDPLFAEGVVWLGRDPESGAPAPQPDIPGIEEITAEPRHYGFHATLKPPMRLVDGVRWEDVVETAHHLAAQLGTFELPPLAVHDLHGFLALRETQPCPLLHQLADACVADFDPLRAPPSESELAHRRRARLMPEQDSLLLRWGYPWVFQCWQFHMTLTRRLTAAEREQYQPTAERHFARALLLPRRVTDICLFVQPEPDVPFLIAERIPLRS